MKRCTNMASVPVEHATFPATRHSTKNWNENWQACIRKRLRFCLRPATSLMIRHSLLWPRCCQVNAVYTINTTLSVPYLCGTVSNSADLRYIFRTDIHHQQIQRNRWRNGVRNDWNHVISDYAKYLHCICSIS